MAVVPRELGFHAPIHERMERRSVHRDDSQSGRFMKLSNARLDHARYVTSFEVASHERIDDTISKSRLSIGPFLQSDTSSMSL